MSIISQTKSFTLKLFTFLSTFLYFCIGIFGTCTGFTFIVFFNTRFYSIFSSIFSSKFLITAPQNVTAAEPLAPTITISEIMSCPLTGGKEWIELARNNVSLVNQVPFSDEYSLTGYRLEDDKSTIWTGNATTPVTFVQNQEMTQIELNKQYLNNTGDSLKLWSPSGELLDQAIIPACKESGYSWSFQDGEWLSGTPSPGEPNPTIPIPKPAPTPTPTPTPSPTPTASPTASVTPTPATSPVPSVSPTPTPADTTSPSFTTQPSVSPVLSSATSAQSAEATQNYGSKNELKSTVIDPTYLQRIFLTTDRNEDNTTPISATIADTSSKVGAVFGTNKISDEHSDEHSELDREITPESDSNKKVQPSIYHAPLPERSPSTYISAILGGVLLTSSGSIHTLHTRHRNGKQTKQTKHSY